MIIQTYLIQREVYNIIIKNKEVFYMDRKMPQPTRVVPTDERLALKIKMSRNKLPNWLLDTFRLTKEEQEQYDKCSTEREIADQCKKDCLSNGSSLQKEEVKE